MSLKGKTNAWIKPSGQFIQVGYMCHAEWASEYFKDRYGGSTEARKKIEEITSSCTGYPHEALHKLGWIRLLTWSDGKTKALGNCWSGDGRLDTMDPALTAKQKETLVEWCLDNDYEYERLFKY